MKKINKLLFALPLTLLIVGCTNATNKVTTNKTTEKKTTLKDSTTKNTLRTVAKVFMLISTIGAGLALIATPILFFFFKDVFVWLLQHRIELGTGIAVAWCIPMTVHYFKCCEDNRQPSTGFKVCTLLFVNLIAGICMLIDRDE